MKTLGIRKQLNDIGLVLLETGKGRGWLVTNNGTTFEKKFADLDAVQMWLDNPARRLTDSEADEFDADWTKFVNQCDGCRRGLPLEGGIHFGEGHDMIACTRRRYA